MSFLLNGLHDALNGFSPRKNVQDKLDSREFSPPFSNLRLETSSESDNEENNSCREEDSKRMRLENIEVELDVGVECDERLSDAQNAWRYGNIITSLHSLAPQSKTNCFMIY